MYVQMELCEGGTLKGVMQAPVVVPPVVVTPVVPAPVVVRGGHAQGRDAGARCCAACSCAACCCAACCCGITVHVAQAERDVLLTRAVEPRVWEMVRHVARGLAHIHSYEARDRAEIAPRSRRDRAEIGSGGGGALAGAASTAISRLYLGYISVTSRVHLARRCCTQRWPCHVARMLTPRVKLES